MGIQVSGIDRALSQLKRYSRTVDDKIKDVIERLMDEGFDIAVSEFEGALYAGVNDVTVLYPYWQGDTMVLAADGKAVAFIEFGTGTNYYDYPDQDVYTAHPDLKPHGEFGKKHGKEVRWWYKGEPGTGGRPKRHTRKDGTVWYDTVWSTSWGNPPARAMYQASKKFDRDHVLEVAREVFR